MEGEKECTKREHNERARVHLDHDGSKDGDEIRYGGMAR